MAICNMKGHLIWRIDNYSARLQQARENEVILKSPIFCNWQYGYTLRVSRLPSAISWCSIPRSIQSFQLDVSLNGFGTWKGRNVLACLTVVAGEWDTLLVWPCKLEADIILRDQPSNLSEVSFGSAFCRYPGLIWDSISGQRHIQDHRGEETHNCLRAKPVHFPSSQNDLIEKLREKRCYHLRCTSPSSDDQINRYEIPLFFFFNLIFIKIINVHFILINI